MDKKHDRIGIKKKNKDTLSCSSNEPKVYVVMTLMIALNGLIRIRLNSTLISLIRESYVNLTHRV